MFITDDVKRLHARYFAQKQPFHAVLLFADDPHDPQPADNVLRAAEDAGHSRINDSIRGEKGDQIRGLLKEIQTELAKVLDDVEETDSLVPDIVPIRIHQSGTRSRQPVAPRRAARGSRQLGEGPERGQHQKGKGTRRQSQQKRRFRLRLPVRSSVIQTAPGQYEVELAVPAGNAKPIRNAYLRLESKTGSDATCETPLRGTALAIDPGASHMEDQPVSVLQGASVRLGELPPGCRKRLSLAGKDKTFSGGIDVAFYEEQEAEA